MFLVSIILLSIARSLSIRYGEVERRAAIRHPFSPGTAAMSANNPLDVGQPDASAFKFVLTVQSLEYAKQLFDIFWIETSAVVVNGNHRFTAFGRNRTDLNLGFGPAAGKLYGVRYQVDADQPQQGTVC